MLQRVLMVAAVLALVGTRSASAFPPIAPQIPEAYKDNADYKAFLTTFEGLKTKCDVCHKPGAEKKAKGHGLNDFGKVYHDRFKPKDYKAANEAKDTALSMKIFKEAWEKSVTEKNADGKVYLDLIKEGKLPGKND